MPIHCSGARPAVARVLLLLLFASLLPPIAGAQESILSLSTGRPDGGYHQMGLRLQKILASRFQIELDVAESSGSVQNLARLADPSSETSLALSQTDALQNFLASNPEIANEIMVLSDVGRECVILIAGKNPGILGLKDLLPSEGAQISVDSPGSGASVTLGYLQALDPAWSNVEPAFVDTMESLLQLKTSGKRSPLKGVMLVQRPPFDSPPIRILLDNPDSYRAIPITPKDLQSSKLPDGSVVYTFRTVRIGGWDATSAFDIDTVCTRAVLIGSKRKLDRETRSRLAQAILQSSRELTGSD